MLARRKRTANRERRGFSTAPPAQRSSARTGRAGPMGAGAPALLLERAGRARGGAAGNHVARADADGRAAIDQVDRIRATGGEAARQSDHVAGAARLHREVLVRVDDRIVETAD